MSGERKTAGGLRVGVMGGSFDPVHVGHVAIAEEAREAFGLGRVIFVPAAEPPHKGCGTSAGGAERLEMVRLAIGGNPHFSVSEIEMRREGPSYTIDTLREIGRMQPEWAVYFIVGADSLAELHTWHRAEELVREFEFIIVGRPGTVELSLEELAGRFGEEVAAKLDAGYLRGGIVDVSATEIRERIRAGRSVRYLVGRDVERYIMLRGLYM